MPGFTRRRGLGAGLRFGLGRGVLRTAGEWASGVASPLAVLPVQPGGSLAGKDSSEDSSMMSSAGEGTEGGGVRGGMRGRCTMAAQGPSWQTQKSASVPVKAETERALSAHAQAREATPAGGAHVAWRSG